MLKIIRKDFYRINGRFNSFFQIFRMGVSPNLRYVFWFRVAAHFQKTYFLGFLCRLVLRKYQIKYGIQIPPETQIGEGFYIGHWGTIIINPKTIIGNNCNIAPGLVIGQTNRGEKKGVPKIGNEVWIGANAVLVGAINIGNNVLIAPNTYLTTDVPSNSIVVGNPANIFPNDNATESYINHKV